AHWVKSRWGRPEGRPQRWSREMLLAVLRVRPDAHVALLEELVREESLVVRLRDPDDRERNGRLVPRAVLARGGGLRLLALQKRNGCGGRSVGLIRDVLVDRSGLPAGEDVLDALNRGVLAAQRDRLQVLGLPVGD